MKPQHIRIRTDQRTGDIWVTEERYMKPIKRLKNISNDIWLCLCADLIAVEGSDNVVKEVTFSDGTAIEVTIKLIGPE